MSDTNDAASQPMQPYSEPKAEDDIPAQEPNADFAETPEELQEEEVESVSDHEAEEEGEAEEAGNDQVTQEPEGPTQTSQEGHPPAS